MDSGKGKKSSGFKKSSCGPSLEKKGTNNNSFGIFDVDIYGTPESSLTDFFRDLKFCRNSSHLGGIGLETPIAME
jgi:hypothetical protein